METTNSKFVAAAINDLYACKVSLKSFQENCARLIRNEREAACRKKTGGDAVLAEWNKRYLEADLKGDDTSRNEASEVLREHRLTICGPIAEEFAKRQKSLDALATAADEAIDAAIARLLKMCAE